MRQTLTSEDIEQINLCFKKMRRNDNFLPITLDKIKDNKQLLEECLYCVDDVYHCIGVMDNYEPNELGIFLYHIEEKLNHQIYCLEDVNRKYNNT